MAAKVTEALGGAGIWGVEFFLNKKDVYFSELSPRPHDTGMVTLAGTQNLNEFELHARTILGIPIPEVVHLRNGASAVVLASAEGGKPDFKGIEQVLSESETEVRVFGKPGTRPYRRMAVVLVYAGKDVPGENLQKRAARLASKISVVESSPVQA
jgi:phosphoribosylglycinamide formyltransferase 2